MLTWNCQHSRAWTLYSVDTVEYVWIHIVSFKICKLEGQPKCIYWSSQWWLALSSYPSNGYVWPWHRNFKGSRFVRNFTLLHLFGRDHSNWKTKMHTKTWFIWRVTLLFQITVIFFFLKGWQIVAKTSKHFSPPKLYFSKWKKADH